MKKPALRIFKDSVEHAPRSPEPTVALKLKRVFPLLVDAYRHNYQWLQDLADDDVIVTQDLADVLQAFEQLAEEKRRA